ncbi:MAG: ATP-binding cassette domain-containing protein, partial [Planctomycetes bacterium]|nr:ATP-binding cassette domain-containing protein [Planctomycetota bacterium]
LPATSGVARVAGFDVMLESTDVRRNIGYLPESVPLYTEMRVDEYLDFRAKLKGVSRTDRVKRVEYCLERCRLVTVRRRLIGTLSKGYRQRVGLSDAMIHNPPILILDEPTAGLDPQQIRETLALLRELGESHTILLSTHILTEVEAICERVIIINTGRIGLNQRLDEIESENIIVMEARGPSDKITQAVQGIVGVTSVQAQTVEGDLIGCNVRTHEDKDVREEVSRVISGKGWPISRLERKSRRLADAFFDILRVEDPLKDVPPTSAPPASVPAPAPGSQAITH